MKEQGINDAVQSNILALYNYNAAWSSIVSP